MGCSGSRGWVSFSADVGIPSRLSARRRQRFWVIRRRPSGGRRSDAGFHIHGTTSGRGLRQPRLARSPKRSDGHGSWPGRVSLLAKAAEFRLAGPVPLQGRCSTGTRGLAGRLHRHMTRWVCKACCSTAHLQGIPESDCDRPERSAHMSCRKPGSASNRCRNAHIASDVPSLVPFVAREAVDSQRSGAPGTPAPQGRAKEAASPVRFPIVEREGPLTLVLEARKLVALSRRRAGTTIGNRGHAHTHVEPSSAKPARDGLPSRPEWRCDGFPPQG